VNEYVGEALNMIAKYPAMRKTIGTGEKAAVENLNRKSSKTAII
jgi:hypothetical protein